MAGRGSLMVSEGTPVEDTCTWSNPPSAENRNIRNNNTSQGVKEPARQPWLRLCHLNCPCWKTDIWDEVGWGQSCRAETNSGSTRGERQRFQE